MAGPTQQRAAQHTQWLLLGEVRRRLEWERRHLVLCRSTLSSFHNPAFVKKSFFSIKNIFTSNRALLLNLAKNGGRLELFTILFLFKKSIMCGNLHNISFGSDTLKN